MTSFSGNVRGLIFTGNLVQNCFEIRGKKFLCKAERFSVECKNHNEKQRDNYNTADNGPENNLPVSVQRDKQEDVLRCDGDQNEQSQIQEPPAIGDPRTAVQDLPIGVENHIIRAVKQCGDGADQNTVDAEKTDGDE